MRSPSTLLKAYLRSYPLSDRVTLYYDGGAGFWCGVFNGLALPLVGVVGRKLGMSSSQLALLMSIQFVALLMNLWLGHLTRPGNLVAFVFWPGFLSRGALLLVALVASPWAYMAVMGFYYLVANLGGPAYSTLMRTNYSDANRGRAMGHIRIMLQAVAALCAAGAGAFLQVWPEGYRLLFPLAAAAGAGSSLLFKRVRPRKHSFEAPAQRLSFGSSLSLIAKDRSFLAFSAITFIAGFPDKILIPLEPIRLVDELGAGYGSAGLVLGTIPLAAAILGYFICSKAANRTDPFILLVATMLLFSTRFLNFSVASTPGQLAPGVFLGGISNAGWDLLPLFSILALADESKVGLYIGFYNTLVGIRGLIGPALGTWLYEGCGARIADIYMIAFWIEIVGAILLFAFWAARRRAGNLKRSKA
jgi:Major Facilitator Superfamily.